MKRLPVLIAASFAVVLAAPSLIAQGGSNAQSLRADLIGLNEVPLVSTQARGEFRARVVNDGTAIEYELSYSDLQADVTQAHIHLGKPLTNGGIAVWLCGTATLPGPTGTPACVGTRTGGASGVITAANVIGPGSQGITAGEFQELLEHIRRGRAYANVHTVQSPGGEIRGQIKPGGGGAD